MTTNEPTTVAAIAEHDAGRLDQAERLYRTRLSQYPEDVVALIGLGDVLTDSGKMTDAEAMYRKAIALDSESQLASGAYDGLAAILQDSGDLDNAIIASKKAAVLRGDADDAFGVGNSLEYLGRIPDAIEMFELAAAIRHEFVEAHAKAGMHLMGTGQPARAIPHYQAAIQAKPDVAELHCNLAAAQQQCGQANGALDAARAALELKADLPEAHNVMGVLWKDRGRWADALGALGRAVKIRPDYADALNNMGVVLQNIGRAQEAGSYFDRAVSHRPDVLPFHLNLAGNLLLQGDYTRGWDEFEWRRADPKNPASRAFPQPMWDGSPMADQSILIHSELSISHAVLFLRYVELVRNQIGPDAKLIVEIQPALVNIVRQIPGVTEVVKQGDALPAFAVHCPLLSLGKVFGTTPQSVPANVPYVKVGLGDVATSPGGLGKRRVGISWSEVTQPQGGKRDRNASVNKLKALSVISGAAFFNLDKLALPEELHATDVSTDMTDLSQLVAAIDGMDVVISADTIVGHLAAAMGKKTYILISESPDWVWLLNRSDSPWYPTVKVLRQSATQSWGDIIAAVAAELNQ